jgi:hypothetical protein
MSSGEFETLSISHVRELVGIPTNIRKTECLVYGMCNIRAAGRIIASEKARPGDITRTKENFHYKPGEPGLLMLDYDGPPGAPALSREKWLACLYAACPALEHTARVWRASTTSYIYDSAGNELRSLTGQRLYVAVVDGADIPKAGDMLFKQLWLKGHGHIEISKASTQLTRALVDACVFSPERLNFVAGAVCKDGLRQGDLTPYIWRVLPCSIRGQRSQTSRQRQNTGFDE